MPTASQVKQFLVTAIVPLVVGALVTWLSGTQVLEIFHTNASAAAGVITTVLIFGVSALISWASAHHILAGHYGSNQK